MAPTVFEIGADFEALITILTEEQGGRHRPPQNRIRWDFAYVEDKPRKTLYMIHPDFLDANGHSIAEGVDLVGSLIANMHIVPRNAVPYHKARLSAGTKFHCHEGAKVVATGVVKRLLGLAD